MFATRMLEIMKQKNISIRRISTDVGFGINQIKYWQTHHTTPKADTAEKIAAYLGVTVDYLLGKENATPAAPRNTTVPSQGTSAHQRASEPVAKRAIRIPVYDEIVMSRLIETASVFDLDLNSDTTPPTPNDKIAAGIPLSSISEFDDYEEFPVDKAEDYEYVALRIHSDAMEPRIAPGDVVIVRLQSDVENGDVAVVTIGTSDFACKKIKKTPEGILLISTNPKHEPIFYSNQQIKEQRIRIFGKVVELRAKF